MKSFIFICLFIGITFANTCSNVPTAFLTADFKPESTTVTIKANNVCPKLDGTTGCCGSAGLEIIRKKQTETAKTISTNIKNVVVGLKRIGELENVVKDMEELKANVANNKEVITYINAIPKLKALFSVLTDENLKKLNVWVSKVKKIVTDFGSSMKKCVKNYWLVVKGTACLQCLTTTKREEYLVSKGNKIIYKIAKDSCTGDNGLASPGACLTLITSLNAYLDSLAEINFLINDEKIGLKIPTLTKACNDENSCKDYVCKIWLGSGTSASFVKGSFGKIIDKVPKKMDFGDFTFKCSVSDASKCFDKCSTLAELSSGTFCAVRNLFGCKPEDIKNNLNSAFVNKITDCAQKVGQGKRDLNFNVEHVQKTAKLIASFFHARATIQNSINSIVEHAKRDTENEQTTDVELADNGFNPQQNAAGNDAGDKEVDAAAAEMGGDDGNGNGNGGSSNGSNTLTVSMIMVVTVTIIIALF